MLATTMNSFLLPNGRTTLRILARKLKLWMVTDAIRKKRLPERHAASDSV